MNKVKIISDGGIFGTNVFDKDGKDVTDSLGIIDVVWRHGAGGTPVVELVLGGSIEVELVGAVKRVDENG